MRRQRAVAVASAALLAQAACASTSYTPRGDGRIGTVMEDGATNLIKDGKRFPAGADGLREAVAGNPAAEEHARAYAQSFYVGLTEELIGFGAIIAGTAIAVPRQDSAGNDLPVSTSRQVAGSVLLGAGLVGIILAGLQLATGQAHYLDAINIYNDGVPPRGPASPAGWQPTSPVPLAPPTPPQAYPPPPLPPVAPSPN